MHVIQTITVWHGSAPPHHYACRHRRNRQLVSPVKISAGVRMIMKYSTRSLQDQPNSGLFRFTLQLVLLTAMSLAFVLTAAGQDGDMPHSARAVLGERRAVDHGGQRPLRSSSRPPLCRPYRPPLHRLHRSSRLSLHRSHRPSRLSLQFLTAVKGDGFKSVPVISSRGTPDLKSVPFTILVFSLLVVPAKAGIRWEKESPPATR